MNSNAEKILKEKIKKHYPNFQLTGHGIILDSIQLTLHLFKHPNNLQDSEAEYFFLMLNSLDVKNNEDLLKLVRVGFLEVLTDNRKSQAMAFAGLKGKILEVYEGLFKEEFNRLT